MATTYAGWVADGRPWEAAYPINALATCLRGYGYTVYILGNESHAQADPPEDHMPYSHTPWPGKQPYDFVLACDIMPPPGGRNLPSLAQLGKQLYDDKKANYPGASWLKYMNWEPSGGSGPCYHDSWQPNYSRMSSTDRGHIHLSGRTDFVKSNVAADYDPIARIRGEDMATPTAKQNADATWNDDIIPAPAPPVANPDYDTNKTWAAKNALNDAVTVTRQNRASLVVVTGKLDEILAKDTSIVVEAALLKQVMMDPEVLEAFGKAVAGEISQLNFVAE